MPDFRQRFQALHAPSTPKRSVVRAQVQPRQDASGQVAILRLFDAIDSFGGMWGISAKEVADALDDLPDGVGEIRVLINSPGGEVFEGIAIANLLRAHPAKVTTVVQGIAASIASCIAVSGDELVMAPNSELMIHNAWGLCVGDATEMRAMADDLDHFSANVAAFYASKAGGTAADWQAVMAGEQWYAADEAVAAGLADRVGQVDDPESTVDVPDPDDVPDAADGDGSSAPMDRWDTSRLFTYAGRRNAPAPRTPAATVGGSTQPQEGSSAVAFSDEQLTTLRQRLGVSDDADETTILAALDEALTESADPPVAPKIPEGMALVENGVLDDLRAKATLGAEARAEQLAQHRAQLVSAAVNDGRIPPARKDHWLAQLVSDPGAESVLAALQPGLIPLAPKGTDNAPEVKTDEDALYASLFGSEKKAG